MMSRVTDNVCFVRRGRLRSAAVWLLAACLAGSPVWSAAARAADTIKIGVFGPMTGDAAANGQSEKEAVDLAVKRQNEAGGLLGKKVEAVYGDDAGRPEEAVSVVKRLISRDGVLMLIGSMSSPASFAASQVARQEEVPQIVVSGTAQKITTIGNKWVFRSVVPDTKLVSDLVDFIHEKYPAIKTFAFLYVNDDFGRGGFTAFKAAGGKYGFQIIDEERYARGDIDFTAQLERIKASGAQALVEWSRYAEGALVAKQYSQLGLTLPRFGSDGVSSQRYIDLGGSAVDGVIYPTHFSPATAGDFPAAKPFIAAMQATYGKQPDSYAAAAYDAATMAMLAIAKAGKEDRAAVRDALASVAFDSVRGPFKFDGKGDPVLTTHVVKIVGGKETNARALPRQN